MNKYLLLAVLATGCTCFSSAMADSIQRVKAGDSTLSCQKIAQEQTGLDETIAAGDPNNPTLGKAAAGTAANAGGQVAGAAVAQSTGLFGALGGLVSKVAGSVAQQQAEERMGPDAEAQQRAAEAKARRDFLTQLASAKQCSQDKPDFSGKALTAEQFQTLANGPAAGQIKPFTVASVDTTLKGTIQPLDTTVPLDGDLKLAGKQIYISEFRVLYEVGGKVTASTRSGYLPGTSYGATHSKINYKMANVDIAALQALTDKTWADFKARVAAAGIPIADHDAFVAEHGEVYEATESASTAAKPVYVEQDLGYTVRKYLVMAPTGMKLLSRGFAGLGAGNIGKRIDFVKNKLDGLIVGVAVNFTNLESSGSGSSILHQGGSSTSAQEGMSISSPPNSMVASGQADAGMVRMAKGFSVPGSFAHFREVGGYDTQKDAVAKSMQMLSALGGVAASKSKTVDMEVDLDGPSTARMSLTGLTAFNAALVNKIKAGI